MTARQVAFRLKSDGKAEVKRDLAEVGQAGASAYGQIEQAANEAGRASDRQMAKWREMARAAKEAERAADQQRRFNAVMGVSNVPGRSAEESANVFMQGRGRGMTTNQRQTLIYTASDILASGASGMSPAMIALQQGPQVLQAWAIEGGKTAATMVKLGAAIGIPAAAAGILAASYLSTREAGRQLEISLSGIGAASGLTADGLTALADANREAGEVSAGAARTMAGAYAETGRIGEAVIGSLITSTKTYAAVTRQDAKSATAELAKAFADPAKGVEVLNAKLGFLDDGTYRYIQTLLEQNRVTDAQLVLSESLSRKLSHAADNVSVLGGAWDTLKLKALGAWEAMGRAVDRALGGGTAAQRIQDLTNERAVQAQVPFGMGNRRVQEIDAELKKIRADLRSAEEHAAATAANQVAADARAAQDRINPSAGRLRELRTDEARIRDALNKGVLSDTKQANDDLAALQKEIKAVEAGYSSASAQASALGRESRKAATEARKDAREAERDAKELARQQERLVDLKLRDRLTIAKLADNKPLIEELETEIRLRGLINDYESAGVDLAKARLMAQRQIGQEAKAEFETRRRLLTKVPADFVSTESMIGKLNALKIGINDNEAAANAMKGAYESAFDRVADRLAAGGEAWGSWRDTARAAVQDVIAEMFKLAAINPLKNALFGQDNPTLGSGGFFSALFGGKSGGSSNILPGDTPTFSFPKSIFDGAVSIFGGMKLPGFANGTDYAPGGWAKVGEFGEELVRLPRGSRVMNAQRTQAMSRGTVSVPIEITLNAQGAGPNEVQALKAEVADLKRTLPGVIVSTVSDAQERRWLRAG